MRQSIARRPGDRAVGSSPAEFAVRVGKDHAVWGKVIREAGIKLD